jgi:N-acetylmuramoyl-L-alanine amidase
MREIKYIVIHHSDSDFGDVKQIDAWHKERGFCSPSGIHCGYHYVILCGYRKPSVWRGSDDGAIEVGRPEEEKGAAVKGHNEESIHICLIGKTKFTRNQWVALKQLVDRLLLTYTKAEVVGHKDLEATECPTFDVKEWWERWKNET